MTIDPDLPCDPQPIQLALDEPLDGPQRREAGLRPFHTRDGDGAVQRHDGGWRDREMLVVQGQDFGPARLAGDRRASEMLESEREQPAIPSSAILLLEDDEISRVVGPRGETRRLKRHERRERIRRRRGGRRMGRHEPDEPQRLGAHVFPDERFATVTSFRVIRVVRA